MNEIKYSAGLVSKPFWFHEFKKTVKLLYEGYSISDIRKMNLEQNIYGAEKEYRAKEVFNCVSSRVKELDDRLVNIFINSDLSTQKAIALFCVLKSDRLFFEFLYEIYREKILMSVPNLTNADIIIFLKDKQCQNSDAAKWTDYTLKKLKNSYINYLFEASFIRDKNKGIFISPPIIDTEFVQYLKNNGYETYLIAMTGVRT